MGSGDIAPQFLTSALVESEWSDPRTYRFTSGKTAPGTHPIGESVGPRDGLYAMKTWKKISSSCPESNSFK
jgi:hypothetical protein